MKKRKEEARDERVAASEAELDQVLGAPDVGVEPLEARKIVAIVGRPNVGKSTLFNRFVGRRHALVEDNPGVTRDRNYADVSWEGRAFTIVDTGGFEPASVEELPRLIAQQAQLAIDEAQVVLLVVDGREGLTAVDQEVAQLLRRAGKEPILVVNKIDGAKQDEEGALHDFYRLGLEKVFAVSAEHARGVDTLKDGVVEALGLAAPSGDQVVEGAQRSRLAPIDDALCRIAVVGRPNVGKSTLLNRLIGEERFVASGVAGTTTDSLDARITWRGKELLLTDTAGIRRKRSIAARLEQFSVMRALSSIERADIVILVIDANEPAVEQDARIAGLALEKGKALVVLVNKWDQVEGTHTHAEAEAELRRRLPWIGFAPVVFGSALTGEKVDKVLQQALRLFEQYKARLPTSALNSLLEQVSDEHPAPLYKGNRVRLYYVAQVGSRPPTFAFMTNRPEGVGDEYRRYITNQLRKAFGLSVPIRLLFKGKSKRVPR